MSDNNKLAQNIIGIGARWGADGWGTALQTGSSWVRFSMR